MKRAVFMWIFSSLLSLPLMANAQSSKKESAPVKKQSVTEAPKQKKETNPATGKSGSPSSSASAAGAPNTAASRTESSAAKPNEAPKVKIVEMTRLNDLSVQVTISVNEGAQQNAAVFAGISGSISLNAEYENGQVATALASVSRDTRRLTLSLRPVTPNPNAGGNITVSEITDKDFKGQGAPTNNGGNKEKGLGIAAMRNTQAIPRLTKATAKLSFNLKNGPQSLQVTDELSRKF